MRRFLKRWFGVVPYKDYDELQGRYLRLSGHYMAQKAQVTELLQEIAKRESERQASYRND